MFHEREHEQDPARSHLKLAREITAFAIGPNREMEYAPMFVAAHGTAVKGSKAHHTTPAIQTILDAWEAAGANASHGPIVTIQKDGAAIMNQAVHGLCTTFAIDRGSGVGIALFGADGKGMLLFCDLCGRDPERPLVDGVDMKHVGKRFRMALKRVQGIKICVFQFNRRLISRLLVETGRYSEVSVTNMFGEGEADAQNVEAVTKLLQAIASFRTCSINNFCDERSAVPSFSAQLKELQILSEYSARLFEVITCQSADPAITGFLPLSQVVRSADTLSHLAFVLFRQNGTAFVPAQHYYNTQIMCRAPHISIATCQSLGIAQYFWYQDSDDREEGAFGMVRTMENGANFDLVEFDARISEVMRIEQIYCRHPVCRYLVLSCGQQPHICTPRPRTCSPRCPHFEPVAHRTYAWDRGDSVALSSTTSTPSQSLASLGTWRLWLSPGSRCLAAGCWAAVTQLRF